MLYLFTGNNRYLIQQEAQKWKKSFAEKYGTENIVHVTSLQDTTHDFLAENFLSQGIFSQKRLILVDGFPFTAERSFSGASDMEAFILGIVEKVPEDIFVVFLSVNPDKRTAAYKKISKVAEVKNYSIESEDQVISKLAPSYSGKIDMQALKLLVYYKGGNLLKTISDIEKLLIVHQKIDIKLIENTIIPEFEESLFVFIDTLLLKNNKKVFKELENLLTFSNFYSVYQGIIANLRVFLYIELLKSQKVPTHQIGAQLKLGNRQFLVQKNHNSKLADLEKLYIDLLVFDKNMKFGKLISSYEQYLHKELEVIFLRHCA